MRSGLGVDASLCAQFAPQLLHSFEPQPQRLEPWLWIRHSDQEWFWDDKETPWQSESLRSRVEGVLADFGVRELPMLVETLPLIVFDPQIQSFSDAAKALWRVCAPYTLAGARSSPVSSSFMRSVSGHMSYPFGQVSAPWSR